MLKLTYTPTTEITDRDLVPGSKWRRKSDGAECVLIRSASAGQIQWCLSHNSDLLWTEGNDPWQIVHADSMLTWLRRDFERVVEKSRHIRRLGEVDFDHLFEHDKKVCVKLNLHTADSILCRRIDDSQQFAVDRDQFVRDLGPIEIDDSVKGVG